MASMLLLLVGLMVASKNLQYQGHQASSQMVPMPKISLAIKQGPWPACIGMTGEDCVSYIESNTEDLTIVVIPDGSLVTQDFRTDRVRVWVDKDDIVFAAPSKG